MKNVEEIIAMRNAFKLVKDRQKHMIKYIPDLRERLERLRIVREQCVGNFEILNEAVESLKRNDIDVRFAHNDKEALKIISNEIDGEIVIKSKSNICREINLVNYLSQLGIKVIETDIGDRILQILNEYPSHPTGPASHLSVETISRGLSEYFGRDIRANPSEIVKLLREDIIKYIEMAEVGISGTNAITKEGSIILVHNEGNIFEVVTRPKKWIILAGIDKIYPSIEDAINAVRIQTFYATGSILPSFIEIISGVSKTADIEKRLVKGVTNPKEVILILLDNGRLELIKNGFRELFYCISCGNCVMNCPAHLTYGHKFKGGRFALYDALFNGNSDLRLCLSCKRCKKNCPLNIDIPSMIERIRGNNKIYNLFYSHLRWLVECTYLESFIVMRKLFM